MGCPKYKLTNLYETGHPFSVFKREVLGHIIASIFAWTLHIFILKYCHTML